MSIFLSNICSALKEELENYLSHYVDVVTIRKYRRTNLPDFENCCIIISPLSTSCESYSSQKWLVHEIEIVMLIKMRNGEYDAVMADLPHDDPPNMGILAMYEDVFSILFKNTLGDEIELYPGLTELDNKAEYNVIGDDDREEFIIEARLLYTPHGHKFIDTSEWES